MELTHGEKVRLAGIRKFGSEEAWRQAQARNGRAGGSVKVAKGFAKITPELQRELSIKGGKTVRRKG